MSGRSSLDRRRKFVLRVSAGIVVLVAIVAATIAVMPAHAAITTPSNGATVSGVVFINENRGGQSDATCAPLQQYLGAPKASSTITVTRDRDSVVVFSQTHTGDGGWSTTWDSRNEPLDGFFHVKSTATDRRATLAGGFCYGSVNSTLSDIQVSLKNWIDFVGDNGAGTIKINPFLKNFEVLIGAFDSGIKSDANMSFQGVPNAPSAPSGPCDPAVDPATCTPNPPNPPAVSGVCTDPTGANFLPYVLENGPQGCLTPNPVPVVNVPPDVPAAPSPPSSQCDITGCGDTVISISYQDADLTLNGVFDTATRNFAANVVLADGSAYTLSHAGSP
ncbi:MAG: hypothetical protein LC750_03205 [Actinobacteria bacterium]|nr:hypothetical protein [Actinomycetota bacterium]